MLRLTAADEADLAVISAQMQDALLKRADLRFDKKRHRFACVANRFAWDASPAKQRRRTGLHFDDVKAVKSTGLEKANAEAVLSLLAITFLKADDLAGTITLNFSAGIQIQLEVSCINATLADLGGTWGTDFTPTHEA
jgi:Protein of unknown function (DUF2948)